MSLPRPALGEPRPHRLQRLDLVRPQGLRIGARDLARRRERRPVHLAFAKCAKADDRRRDGLAVQHRLGVRAPRHVGGLDDQPLGEGVLAGRGEEGVDVLLADAPVGVEELALDRGKTAVVQRSDEIDPGVGTVEFAAARPVGPEFDTRKAL